MSQYNEIIMPESVFESVRSFNQYVKRNVTVQPQGASGAITANQQIEFALPVGQLVDISSFAVNLQGITLTGTSPSLPAWSDSVIQRVEVLSNGNTIQVINNYNIVANVMRNLTATADYALSYGSVYGGGQNTRVTATDANYNQVISNWLGFLGCKKIIPVMASNGMMDLRVRLTMAPNSIMVGTSGPTYSFNKVFATVNVITMSEPSLEQAIQTLNGTPEIAFDYFTNYSENYAGNSSLALKVPVVASSLKAIVLTSRISTYSTNAAVSVSGRQFETSNYFKFNGSTLSDLYIDTGAGNFPSQALAKSADALYFTAEGLGCDDNVLCGAIGIHPQIKDTLASTALAQDLYEDWGYGVVFSFNHRDAPAGLLMGYNTKGNATMLIRGTQAGGADTYQLDAFAVSSAVLTLGKGQWSLQV